MKGSTWLDRGCCGGSPLRQKMEEDAALLLLARRGERSLVWERRRSGAAVAVQRLVARCARPLVAQGRSEKERKKEERGAGAAAVREGKWGVRSEQERRNDGSS